MRLSYISRIAALALSAGAMAVGSPVIAALGSGPGSVEADRAHLSAAHTATAVASHVVHALSLANGAVNREFVRSDGVVFAITWRGASRPDLRQLLGSYFDRYQAVAAAPHRGRPRRPPSIDETDFVVQSGGHSGAFWGVAYLPKLAPAGFSVTELK